MGGGSGGKKDPLQDAFNEWQGKQDLPDTREGIAQNMMERGRPNFDFSKMGMAGGLAGQVAQPAYSTPPPQFNKDFWLKWEEGDAVDGADYKGAVSPSKFDKLVKKGKSVYDQGSGGSDDSGGNQYGP